MLSAVVFAEGKVELRCIAVRPRCFFQHRFACRRARNRFGLEKHRVWIEFKTAQMAQHLSRALVSVLRIFLHGAEDYLLKSARYRRIELCRRRRSVVYMLEYNGYGRVRGKGKLARYHFVEHYSERIDIASRVYLAASRLLR